jgi:hypothetical protein
VRRRLAPALCAAVLAGTAACGASSADPAVEVVAFEPVACEPGVEGVCYRLSARVVGTRGGGEGSCALVAVSRDGRDLRAPAQAGPIPLDPGSTFTEVLVLPTPADPAFDHWAPTCTPTGEG